MDQPLNSSTNRCLAQDRTSDLALSYDSDCHSPVRIALCTNSIGFEPEVEKSRPSLPAGITVIFIGAPHLLQLHHAHLRGARLYAISCTRSSRNFYFYLYLYSPTSGLPVLLPVLLRRNTALSEVRTFDRAVLGFLDRLHMRKLLH